MPGTEVVQKQTVLGGAAGIALLAFALIWRFYPGGHHAEPQTAPQVAPAPVAAPSMTLAPTYTQSTAPQPKAPATPQPQPPDIATPPAPPPPKAIAALLKKADKAFAAEHLLEPKDTSALALYQQVLSADKDNAAAQAGIEKIHKSLLQQAGVALDRGDEKESARLIAANPPSWRIRATNWRPCRRARKLCCR